MNKATTIILLFLFICALNGQQFENGIINFNLPQAPGSIENTAAIDLGIFSCPIDYVAFEQTPWKDISAYNDPSNYPMQKVADDFVLSASHLIDEVCFVGAYAYSNDFPGGDGVPDGNDNFSITYYNDMGNLPGSIYAGPFNVIPTINQNTGISGFLSFLIEFDIYGFHVEHEPVSFEAGTRYWIKIENNTPTDADGWVWVFSDQSEGGSAISIDGGTEWFLFDENNLTFSLGGERTSSIPTISQWGIFILALILLIFGLVRVTNIDLIMD